MKQLAKNFLPKPIVRFATRIRHQSNYQNSPRIAVFQGTSKSVLQCCIAYNQYGGYCVPLSSRHRPAAQKILTGAIWEPKTIEFLMSQGKDGDIIHAGTFFGDFLPALSQSRANGLKVWAFEPNPENYRCALITKYINELDNVELVNAGLGERKSSHSMVILDDEGKSLGGGSRIEEKAEQVSKENSATVQIVTVDEIVPPDRKVSVIQLDVEGYEKPALIGALMTIRRCKPIIVLETLPEESWLSEHILQLGYRIEEQIHENTILRCD
jgi:FkbM family methyltransferase